MNDRMPGPTRRGHILLLAEIALLVVAYFVVPISEASLAQRLILYGLGMLLVVAITVRQTNHYIRGADLSVRVDSLLLAIVLSTLLFALSYSAIDATNPDQIEGLVTRLDALYFSISTTATVGFGDVHATGQLARAIVTIQIIFNLVVVATAASVLGRAVAARRSTR